MLEIGSYVDGRYKILSEIGRGGMSVVYLALNERANKTWAVKEVRRDGRQDFAAVKQGLIAEIGILKRLNHRYLPGIADIIDDGDSFLIVMDYIQGKSLDQILRQSMEKNGRPVSVEEVISWGKQLCDVLYYLHTQPRPIIYRDMKPSNVMLKPSGEISLIDFGTARTFKTENIEDTMCLGTPGYASPEQYGGNGQSTPRSDIYCLGATLHHLITGRNPAPTPFNFPRITQCRPTLLEENPREWRNALLGLEMVIARCTQYEPADRYASCLEMQYDLDHIEELGLPYRKKLKRRLGAFAVCAALALTCGGVSVFGGVRKSAAEKSGYDYYLDQAEKTGGEERAENCRTAIRIDPSRDEAYLTYLETLQDDEDGFSGQDAVDVQAILNESSGKKRCEDYFKENKDGYVRFSYELGKAYYFNGGGGKPGGDRQLAGKWLQNVSDAGFADEKYEELGIDWTMTQTFLEICSYYSRLGEENEVTGELEFGYGEFWEDLTNLFANQEAEVSSDSSKRLTQLRLYADISWQLYTYAANFAADAGIAQEDFTDILDALRGRVSAADCGSSKTAGQVKESTLKTIDAASDRVASLYDASSEIGKGGADDGREY